MHDFLHAAILGIVEGLTEFLPISSTGHMILVSAALRLQNDEFLKTFEIFIQLGAIFAIVFLYARRLIGNMLLYKKLAAAFLPTAVLGFLAYKFIKTYLFSPLVVSLALIAGGIVLLLLDKRLKRAPAQPIVLENIPYRRAAMIGLFQSLSMIPGVSRAAATIIGGVFQGLDKRQALEFSFLLAVPTMLAATLYDLFKTPLHWTGHQMLLLALGWGMAFVSATVAVKLFLAFVHKHGFAIFGIYRIVLGIFFLLLFYPS